MWSQATALHCVSTNRIRQPVGPARCRGNPGQLDAITDRIRRGMHNELSECEVRYVGIMTKRIGRDQLDRQPLNRLGPLFSSPKGLSEWVSLSAVRTPRKWPPSGWVPPSLQREFTATPLRINGIAASCQRVAPYARCPAPTGLLLKLECQQRGVSDRTFRGFRG